MKQPRKKAFLDMVAQSEPQLADLVGEVKRDHASGKLRFAPRTYLDCRDWWDAWLYIFRRGRTGADHNLRVENDKVTHVALVGPDFNDAIVQIVERLVLRLGENRDLTELRLIRTRLTAKGVGRLKNLFPNSQVIVFTKEQEDRDPSIIWVDGTKWF
jgi:hypothetical protein